MKNKEKGIPEVVIPAGYRLDEVLDFDDDEFKEEQPIYVEEVKLRFERNDNQ